MSTRLNNPPNAGKLVESLRYVGYDNYDAIADIVDNSFDAGASNVYIDFIGKDDDLKMIIADDGHGMDEKLLIEALKLGSLSEKDHAAELGKFGMGLNTASLSICRKVEIISRTEGGEMRYAAQDVDVIARDNEFTQTHEPADVEAQSIHREHLGSGPGTVLVWSKIDHLQNKNVSVFADTLSLKLGRIFRYFLMGSKKIFVRGTAVEMIDPLMRGTEGSEIRSEAEYEVPGMKGEKIRVVFAVLPDFPVQTARDKKINVPNQGFYIMRNFREVEAGTSLDLFVKHNSTNRIRIELFMSGKLDHLMGINFRKKDVRPSQSILDLLKREVMGEFDKRKEELVKKEIEESAADVDHSPAEELISAKSNLLILPRPVVGDDGKPKSLRNRTSEANADETGVNDSKPEKGTRNPLVDRLGVKFLHKEMTAYGPLYDVDQVGKTVYVAWNVDHPFFEEITRAKTSARQTLMVFDCLVAALAYAELKNENDGNRTLIENIKATMSTNLKVMLSK